jgi:hypothetical protein
MSGKCLKYLRGVNKQITKSTTTMMTTLKMMNPGLVINAAVFSDLLKFTACRFSVIVISQCPTRSV